MTNIYLLYSDSLLVTSSWYYYFGPTSTNSRGHQILKIENENSRDGLLLDRYQWVKYFGRKLHSS